MPPSTFPLAPRRRGRATSLVLAAVLAIVALPGAPAVLQAQETEEEPGANYRLTDASFRKFSIVTRDLAALIRRDPAVARALGSDDGVPPAAARIFTAAGISRDEYVECFAATLDATFAARVLEHDPSLGADFPELVKTNASFLKRKKVEFDRLLPDMKTIQEAGRSS